MGTSAETANVVYCLSFANQGKQTSVLCQFAKNKQKFAISVFRLQLTNGSCDFPLVPLFIYIYIQSAA
jgi:hypothetical protein